MGTFPMALHLLLLRSKVRSALAPCTIRRCSSAYRSSLVSAYMQTPGMMRCTVALSLLLQREVGSFMRVLVSSHLEAAMTWQEGCMHKALHLLHVTCRQGEQSWQMSAASLAGHLSVLFSPQLKAC